jgi:lipoprotein-releasing system ATP-binding protein
MAKVEVTQLRKTYRLGRVEVPVLKGVDFTCESGECVAILGASGSGKSTLLHLIGGLDRPDRNGGCINVDGRDITAFGQRDLNTYRAQRIGFVFQFYHLLPELSVLQNVLIAGMVRHGMGFPGRRSAVSKRANELLDALGLAHRLMHRPAELSGGERQRVAIARALINDPDLFLADEPTGNLDQETGSKILDAIMTLREGRRRTMIVVTHDAATAARADRTVRIANGVLGS